MFVVREKGAKSITLCNRNAERGLKLAEEFGINSITESELGKLGIGRYQLIINATPVGSHLGNGELPFLFTELSPQHIVFRLQVQCLFQSTYQLVDRIPKSC